MATIEPQSVLTPVTPAPDTAPILAGEEHQAGGSARGFRPAGTRDWLCVSTLGGRGYVRTGDQVRLLHRGDVLLYAPDTAQDYGWFDEGSAWVNIWVHVHPRPHWLPWLIWPQVAPGQANRGVMVLGAQAGFDAVEAALRDLVQAGRQPARLQGDRAMNAMERVLLLCDDLNPLHRSAHLDPRIRRVLDHVGARLAEVLDIGTLADVAGLSRSRFSVLFTRQMQMTPQAYVEFTRLSRAAQLLTLSHWPVARIAEDVGFPDPYYFSTRFRLRFGQPPSIYRAQGQS